MSVDSHILVPSLNPTAPTTPPSLITASSQTLDLRALAAAALADAERTDVAVQAEKIANAAECFVALLREGLRETLGLTDVDVVGYYNAPCVETCGLRFYHRVGYHPALRATRICRRCQGDLDVSEPLVLVGSDRTANLVSLGRWLRAHPTDALCWACAR